MKTLNKTEFKNLKTFLNKTEADPTFLNYGGFLSKIKEFNYHKSYRKKIKPFKGMYKIWLSSSMYQFDKENGYNILLNELQKNEVLPIIENRKKTPYFLDHFNTIFNCYTYDYTIYSDDFEKYLNSDNWWLTHKTTKKIHLDSNKKTDNNLKNEVLQKCLKQVDFLEKKGLKINGYEVTKRYDNVNFTPSEFRYICDEIIKTNEGINGNRHPTHQITRRMKNDVKHRLNEFKEYVLKPTNRKVLMDIHTYGITYIEIEKIKDFNF